MTNNLDHNIMEIIIDVKKFYWQYWSLPKWNFLRYSTLELRYKP